MGKMAQGVEVHVQQTTPFITGHWRKLLPDWKSVPQTIAIVFLQSLYPLDGQGDSIEGEKNRLLDLFLQFGGAFYSLSQQRGFAAEIISPKDGTAIYSKRGEFTFDLVAMVHQSLGLSFSSTEKGCKVLTHPEWGTSFYPGLFLSEATQADVQGILNEIDWVRNNCRC